MSRILVIGSGSRECIIVKKLYEDALKLGVNVNIYCIGTNNNPYINEKGTIYVVDKLTISNLEDILTKIEKPDFAIIGPEAPLELGFADYLEICQISCIGPLEIYAKIETSKIYARKFIDSIGLNQYSPKYSYIEGEIVEKLNINDRKEFINNKLNTLSCIVVKKDGLCGGKGVKVQGVDFKDTSEIFDELCDLKKGENVIIEHKLNGEEFSLMTITDGYGNMGHFPPIQDYKRLNDNDNGPNTGGMGCIIDQNNTLPFLSELDILCAQNINKTVIEGLNNKRNKYGYRIGYRGILYGSYIKNCDGKIYIIEFNSRFGDPECIIGLTLLKTNFLTICNEIAQGKLISELIFSNKAMIGVYLVPKSYPKSTKDKFDIYINDNLKKNVIYGNVEKAGDHLYTLSSRSLVYYIADDTIGGCYNKLYKSIKNINGNLYYRKDIGAKLLSSYDKAGVSIDCGNKAIKEMKKYLETTYTKDVLGKHGDFGGQFRLGNHILVSSIDGVGTKSILATKVLGDDAFINLGKDIVNHSVNDILVQGAYPLFFLDYFGTSHLRIEEVTNFIKGASEACVENGPFPLIGGETAEMPSVYIDCKTDLVGCIVGIKEENFFKGTNIECGDILVGFPSVSPHTNGYSLINKIMEENGYPDDDMMDIFLRPHKSYLNEVKKFVEIFGYDSIKGMCHITGGGLFENLNRIIPSNLRITLDIGLNFPDWCLYLKEKGNISHNEMLRVFNCGIGFVIVTNKETLEKIDYSFDNSFFKLFRVGIIS